jgi:hypothetical protein
MKIAENISVALDCNNSTGSFGSHSGASIVRFSVCAAGFPSGTVIRRHCCRRALTTARGSRTGNRSYLLSH